MFGIGFIEILVLLLIIGGFAAMFMWGRPKGMPHSAPHPKLSACPGCNAKVTSADDNCPQCGLRLSN
jgi:hypothetical protein